MKVMIKIVCVVICLSALSGEAVCQNSRCGTPVECYEKSLQNLQQARSEISELGKAIQVLQTQLENLKNENIKLKGELTASETRLKTDLRNVNDRISSISLIVERKPELFDMAGLGDDKNCDPANSVVYGFRNALNNIQSLDMWRCAILRLSIPPVK